VVLIGLWALFLAAAREPGFFTRIRNTPWLLRSVLQEELIDRPARMEREQWEAARQGTSDVTADRIGKVSR
jgi:hypothetical protein